MGAVTARLAPHILSQAIDDVNTQVDKTSFYSLSLASFFLPLTIFQQHQCQAPKQPVPEEQGEED